MLCNNRGTTHFNLVDKHKYGGPEESPPQVPLCGSRDQHTHKRDDLFAAAPPLEALKLIWSMTATANRGGILMISAISRPFFHARAKREVDVQLPKEEIRDGEEALCGRLMHSLHGTRDAAQIWYEEYSNQIKHIGSKHGRASPCIFHHPERGIRTYVHGCDNVST